MVKSDLDILITVLNELEVGEEGGAHVGREAGEGDLQFVVL